MSEAGVFQSAFEQSPIAASITRPDGRFMRVNRALAALLGYPEAELLDRPFQTLTHPDDLAENLALLQAVLDRKLDRYCMEKRMIRANGEAVWVQLDASIVREVDGTPAYLVTQYQDLTERRRVEDQVLQSELYFRALTERSSELVLVVDDQGLIRYANPASVDVLGYEPRELLGRPGFDFIDPGDLTRVQGLFVSIVGRPGAVIATDYTARHRDGSPRLLRAIGKNLLADPAVRGIVMNAYDITEIHRAARELEASQQQYRSLFDQNPDAVYSLDTDGHFLSANAACFGLSGYAPDELIGMSFEPLISVEDLETTRAHFRSAVAGTSTRYEIALRHRSGRRIPIAVTKVPIVVGGRVVGVFGIAKDLTPQRALEHQLREAQKLEAVGRLAGGVAHDFNNLLTVITSYTQMVLADVPRDSAFGRDLREIEAAAGRAAGLTRQLLAFSRKQVLQPRQIDVNHTVSEAARMLQRVIGEDIRLETELTPTLWSVNADPGQLEQVLMNLAVNARDAMPAGGTLTLRTANLVFDANAARERLGLVAGDYAGVIVEDNGTGIDSATLPYIFEPFYTTKALGQGTGLGLATVYGIVKQSGGYIYVDSTVGEGSRFMLLLPRSDGATAAEPAPPSYGPPRGTETVLLVEDESAVRGAIRRMLRMLGYTVFEADSGTEALRVATDAATRGEQIHLVLTDVVMPGLNGRELREQLAIHWPHLKVLYMSGYTDDEILRRGLMHSSLSFLEKPFSAQRLADVVRSTLDRPGSDS